MFDLIKHDWEILHQIISDCDQKFLLSFWCVIFECLSTKLLISTAYYSQTDSQFKWTNQTVEIVLHYFLTLNFNKIFITVLLYLQDYLNNSWNLFISYTFNKLLYSFQTNDILDVLLTTDLLFEDYTYICQINYKEIKQVLVFANIILKSYYNEKHCFILLKLNVMIFLHLFHSYIIFSLINRKLLN